MNKIDRDAQKLIGCFVIFALLVKLVLICVVSYVVFHFIQKYW